MKVSLDNNNYVDLERCLICSDNSFIKLSSSECRFLEKILKNNFAVPYDDIAIYIWGQDALIEKELPKAVHQLWSNLKRKVPNVERYIATISGSGYQKKEINPSPYDTLLLAVNRILSTSLPDYSTQATGDTKHCTVSRAALISLVKYYLNIDIDNELSEGYSIDELNQRIRTSNCDFLKEYAKLGYSFEKKNDLIVTKSPKNAKQAELDDDTLFETLKILHNAYTAYDIHSDFSSPKKIELNCTISVFINALSFRGIFNTIERKKYFCELLRSLIQTHNHDCNYLYPILSNIKEKEKRPPLVEVDMEQVVDFVGSYCNDVYLTDCNALGFIGNFIKTLDYYGVDKIQKVNCLEQLIYDKKTYDLRIIEALTRTEKSRLVTLQKHFEANVFSLANSQITEDVKRELIAFICMFWRGSFDALIYFEAPTSTIFLSSFSELINFVIRKFDFLTPVGHIRRKDFTNGLSRILLTMRKYDEKLAKKALEKVNIANFEGHKLFTDTYAFIIDNEISVLCAAEYSKSFSTRKEFFDYIQKHLICSKNPFLQENDPLLLIALNSIRSAINGDDKDKITVELRSFADNLLFWMIEAAETDAHQNMPLRYLHFLSRQYPNCLDWNRNKEYIKKKQTLFVSVLQSKNFSLLEPSLLQTIWVVLTREARQTLSPELNECINHIFNSGTELEAIDFLLSNYLFVTETNREKIADLIKNLVNNRTDLAKLPPVVVRKIVTFVTKNPSREEAKTERKQLLVSLPYLERLSIYDKFDGVCWKLLDKMMSKEIARSITNGEAVYRELLDFLIGSKFRSWQRACFKDLFANLLQPEAFWTLDLKLQINLIHYVKDKGEYYDDLKCLMRDIVNKSVFLDLDSNLKTALTIHCRHYIDLYDPQNSQYLDFLESILNTLTQNTYTHTEIKNSYGLRTDTLIYHILEIYKSHPDKTAIICISSICKIYKQLLSLSSEDAWNPYKAKLLTDRVNLFATVIANPCIRNISQHYAQKMYRLINGAKMDTVDSHLKAMKRILVGICKHSQWPNWFDNCAIDIQVLEEDTIQQSVCIEKSSFLIDSTIESNSSRYKAKEELTKWRDKMDDSPLIPSEHCEVVALRCGHGYTPISGWGLVYECINSNNIVHDEDEYWPSEIVSTVVSIAKIEPLEFNNTVEELSYEKIIRMYNQIFNDIIALIPVKAQKRKKGQQADERIYIREDYTAIDKSLYPQLVAFLDFYYDHVYRTPRIRESVLAPYYDYYKSVKKEILVKLKKAIEKGENRFEVRIP